MPDDILVRPLDGGLHALDGGDLGVVMLRVLGACARDEVVQRPHLRAQVRDLLVPPPPSGAPHPFHRLGEGFVVGRTEIRMALKRHGPLEAETPSQQRTHAHPLNQLDATLLPAPLNPLVLSEEYPSFENTILDPPFPTSRHSEARLAVIY